MIVQTNRSHFGIRMQRKPWDAPLLSRTENEVDLAKRTLLFVDVPATTRCSQFGNTVNCAGPITAQLMSKVLPDIVVISLISNNSDAIEDIEALSALGFRGRCFVLANRLPNRRLVLQELRRHAAGLRISLLTVQA